MQSFRSIWFDCSSIAVPRRAARTPDRGSRSMALMSMAVAVGIATATPGPYGRLPPARRPAGSSESSLRCQAADILAPSESSTRRASLEHWSPFRTHPRARKRRSSVWTEDIMISHSTYIISMTRVQQGVVLFSSMSLTAYFSKQCTPMKGS